jgi:hypothetical protein
MFKSAIIGTFTILCFWCSAHAETPQAGQPFSTPNGILCDERVQIDDLLAGAKEDDGKGIIPRYKKWNALIDKQGEPTCLIQPIINANVKSVEDIGETKGFDGAQVHGWVIEISGTDGETGFLLYGEVVPGTDA